ncbi:MAG: 3-dehydroquinate synthase [Simkania sp.]|nr:3-dehydroquinate synthase [Simkania sp.]
MDLVDSSCSSSSTILIGESLNLAALIKAYLPKECHRIAIITDANVAKIHGTYLSASLDQEDLPHVLIPFPAGEEFKTRKTKDRIEDLLLSQQFNRDCAIIGFGGGVVTDLAGFIAATYVRGIPFIAIPTTLLGMVDASIGGKVAVNTPLAKNAIGSFYSAKAILIDVKFLETLDHTSFLNGMAEVYKYAFIASPQLIEDIQDNLPILEIIRQSCSIKQTIVESDFTEKGQRRILNFGHTIGHALEIASDYRIPHGFAIAAGMRAESWLSHRLGYLSREEFDTIEHLLTRFPSPPSLQTKKIHQALFSDKKCLRSKIRFVLLGSIGHPLPFDGQFCRTVEEKLIEEAISILCNT